MAEMSPMRAAPKVGEDILVVRASDEEAKNNSFMPLRHGLVLLCTSFFSFGAHVAYKSLSGIEGFLKDSLDTDSTGYGVLNSAVSWSSLALLPFLFGVLVDGFATRYASLVLALVCVFGHLLFTIAVYSGSFELAVTARAIFGVGEASLPIAQGAVCVQWFSGRGQMALAVGVIEMTHNIGNWLGKVAIDVAEPMGGEDWKATLWFGLAMCVLSVSSVAGFWILERREEQKLVTEVNLSKQPPRCRSEDTRAQCGGLRELSFVYWMLVLLHALVSNVEHLFDAVSSNFIKEKWGLSYKHAAWFSSTNYAVVRTL
eukprot:6014268-Prymnesium_polylepis.2